MKVWISFFIAVGIVVLIVVGINTYPDSKIENSYTFQTDTNLENVDSELLEESSEYIPSEHYAALRSAESYLNSSNFSKNALYDQLISEYGGQFTNEAALYAINNVEANWYENAYEAALYFRIERNMSDAAIFDQLTSEYGGYYTDNEAIYAINKLH